MAEVRQITICVGIYDGIYIWEEHLRNKRRMMIHASNGQINTNGEQTGYISFGKGDKNLIIIPGVGDGLKTVKGMALPFVFLYRELAKGFKVYVFSRPVNLETDATTSDMAESLYKAKD